MRSHIRSIYLGWLVTLSLFGTLAIESTHAQPIVPGTDTNTQVTPNGNTFTIEGGTLSGDGTNLFHTFKEFGLSAGEIANFMSNPQIHNILTQINGGNPSIINGLIQITGGSSNLFLMNPSGILFGSGASLNIPGSLTVTTADRMGFDQSGSVQWFDAQTVNNYESLVGTPSQFVFTMAEAGAIVNAGNLGVGAHQNLILLGGSVVSTGTLSAGGNLIVAAVPSQNLVRISQVGNLLSFEVDPALFPTTTLSQAVSRETQFNPLSLPELLAGGGGTHATGVQLNSDGTVTLTGSGLRVEQGDVVSQELRAHTGIVFATGNITGVESRFETTGNLHLQADNGVRLEDSRMNPLELRVGKNLQIRGDRQVTLDLLNHPNSQIQVQGNLSLVSDDQITLNGTFSSGGNLSILNTLSQPMAFESTNLFRVSAEGNVVFGDYTGGRLQIDAAGGILGGNISLPIAETSTVSERGVVLYAGRKTPTSPLTATDTQGNDAIAPGSIVVGDITIERPDISLRARGTGAIQTGTISTAGGNVNLTSGSRLNLGGMTTAGGNITLTSLESSIDTGNILDASSDTDRGGAIALTAVKPIIPGDLITENNHIQINGPLYLSNDRTFRTTGSGENAGGGNIQALGTINGNFQLNLEAGTGNVVLKQAIGNEEAIAGLSIHAQNIDLFSTVASQGAVNLDATGTVTLGDRLTTTEGMVQIIATDAIVTDDIIASGSDIDLHSHNGAIATGDLQTAAIAGDGGTISLRSGAGLSTGAIDTHSNIGVGGDVTLHTEQHDIQASFINAEGATQGGTVEIQTPGSVRIIDSFLSQTGSESSISTAAPQGGEITITHGRSAFVIGDLDGDGVIENGAIAGITTGSGEFLSVGESVAQSRIYLNPNLPPESSSETPSESETTTEEETESSQESNPPESDAEPVEEAVQETDSAPEDSSPESPESEDETAPVEETTAPDPESTVETPAAEFPTPEEPVAVEEPAESPTPTPTPEAPESTAETPVSTPTPEEPVAVSEPVSTPTPTPTPEEPVAVSEPVSTPTPTPTPEAPVVVSEPVSTPIPTPTPTPEAPVSEPVSTPTPTPTPEAPVSEPVSTPTPTPTPEAPVAVSEPVSTPTPTPTPEAPVAVSEPVSTPTPTPTPEAPVAVSEPQGIEVPQNIPVVENPGNLEPMPTPEQMMPLPVVEILPSGPAALPVMGEVPSPAGSAIPPEIPGNAAEITPGPEPLISPMPVNGVEPPASGMLVLEGTEQLSPTVPPPSLPRTVVESESGPLGSQPVPILEVLPVPINTAPNLAEVRVPTVTGDPSMSRTMNSEAIANPAGEPVLANPEIRENLPGTVNPGSETGNPPAIASSPEPDPPQTASLQSELEAVAQIPLPPIEQMRMQEFYSEQQGPLSEDEVGSKNVRALLQGIRQEIQVNPAVIYAISLPEELQLVVMTAEGVPIVRTIPSASRNALRAKVTELLSELTNPRKTNTDSYMSASVQLYQWLIAPIAAELEAEGIDLLMFSLDAGLRGIPLAALHDGEQFLIEKYRLGLIPSVNLTETSYKNLNQTRVLAMGASNFQDPTIPTLNAVPLELAAIAEMFSLEEYFLNEGFTADNLRASRRQENFDIIHLATHVKFYAGMEPTAAVPPASRRKSYIQFWDEQVPLEQMQQLGFDAGTVELLVLSACETAVGSLEVELGFAGLAVKMGVKSVLASLWQVDDEGTLGLMSEFYEQLSSQDQTIKSEALRQAQLAFLRGEVRVSNNQLRTSRGEIDLPLEMGEGMGDRTFVHPYFWAAFTLVGSPW